MRIHIALLSGRSAALHRGGDPHAGPDHGSAAPARLSSPPSRSPRPSRSTSRAVTGDYLYWSFPAEAGQRPDLTATVALPPSADRHGAQSWTVEVFDGLRRRQACVAGEQSPQAAADAATVALRLPAAAGPLVGRAVGRRPAARHVLRAVVQHGPARPGPGPADPGRPVARRARQGDTGADQGVLAAPLVPNNRPGSVLPAGATAPVPSASASAGAAATTAGFRTLRTCRRCRPAGSGPSAAASWPPWPG